MADQIINARIQLRHDANEDWSKATEAGFRPLEGEPIFYTDLNKIKVGKKDATGNLIPLSALAFLDARDADTVDGKHASEFVLKTEAAPVDAEKNVQSDWNITDATSDAYIKNKPNVVLEGDVRLTNARPPTSHNQAATTITEDATHRFVTDTEKVTWNAKSNFSGSYTDLTNKPTIPTVNNATLTIQKNGTNVATFTANSASNATANIAVPTKVSELTNDSGFKTTDNNQAVKTGSVTFGANDVVEFVAGSNVSISGDATNKKITISSTDTNTEATLVITDKANTDTTDLVYAITNIAEGGTKGHTLTPTFTGLPTKAYVDTALAGKAAASHGTHVTYGTTAPVMDGTASVGSATTVARSDHKHPTDTSRAAAADLTAHLSTHAPANAQKNSDITKAEIEAKLTGTITSHAHSHAVTPPVGTNNTQIATTAFVKNELNTLISSGTADPSASITSQYYFKY